MKWSEWASVSCSTLNATPTSTAPASPVLGPEGKREGEYISPACHCTRLNFTKSLVLDVNLHIVFLPGKELSDASNMAVLTFPKKLCYLSIGVSVLLYEKRAPSFLVCELLSY